MSKDDNSAQLYKVLLSIEEQYGYWPAAKEDIPLGWKETGKIGTKDECAAYVKEVWTDMRPLSLRSKMDEEDIIK